MHIYYFIYFWSIYVYNLDTLRKTQGSLMLIRENQNLIILVTEFKNNMIKAGLDMIHILGEINLKMISTETGIPSGSKGKIIDKMGECEILLFLIYISVVIILKITLLTITFYLLILL